MITFLYMFYIICIKKKPIEKESIFKGGITEKSHVSLKDQC